MSKIQVLEDIPSRPDLSITDFVLDSTSVNSYYLEPIDALRYSVTTHSKLTVLNESDVAVHTLRIGDNHIEGINCVYIRTIREIELEEVLMPGEEITINVKTHYGTLSSSSFPFEVDLEYFVFAPNHMIDGDPSNDRSIKMPIELTTSVRKPIALETNVEVFPNPSNGLVFFNGYAEQYQITLFNLNGQALKVFMEGHDKIDLSQFSSGSYILKFENEDGIFAKSLILN